ncbi:MAG: alpha/beta fold hydrolase [Burkholderiales bacterium]
MASALPTWVLLHGWGSSASVWDPVRRRLTRTHQVEAPDLFEVAPDAGIDTVVDALHQRYPGPVAVCGWSLGGIYAQAWALAHPEQVRRLVLTASTPSFLRRDEWAYGMSANELETFIRFFEQDPRGTMKRFAALGVMGGREAAPEVGAHLREAGRPALARADWLRQGLQVLADADFREQAELLACPVDVVHGGLDRIIPVEVGEWLANRLPRGCLTRWDDASHVPFLARPDAFALLIDAYGDDRDV